MDIRNPVASEVVDLSNQVSELFGYNKDEPGITRDFPLLYHPNNFKHLWIATEGAGVVAHAGFLRAVMKVESFALPVAGIGGVFTKEQHQGQGWATKLVQKCADEASKEGCALAFLWSDKHEFYKKSGFHLVGRQWALELLPEHAEKLRERGQAAQIPANALLITDENLSDEFIRQSHALLSEYPLGIARTLEEHSLYIKSGACNVISAWVGKELAAYFLIGKGRDLQGYIHEWAGIEGALHHLAAKCLEDFEQKIVLLSPQFMQDEVPWLYSLEEIGVPAAAEYLALVKLLSFEKLQKLVANFLARIGLKPEELQIEKLGEDIQVTWRNKPAIHFDEASFLQFLFGPELPQDPELRAFLPMRLWYWGMDSV